MNTEDKLSDAINNIAHIIHYQLPLKEQDSWLARMIEEGLVTIKGDEEETFVCARSGKSEYMDSGFLVPNVGMVSENHMRKEDWEAWDRHNAKHNPDSYSREQLIEWGLHVEGDC